MRTRFLAKIGANHRGDLARALGLIDAAAEAGCTAVCFEHGSARAPFAPEAWQAEPERCRREAGGVPESFLAALSGRTRARGLQLGVTPLACADLARIVPWVDLVCVAPTQLPWRELLVHAARCARPLVLGTALATLDEVRAAVECLRRGGATDWTLLHGVGGQPTPVEHANLAAIETLRRTFSASIGWADSTRDPSVLERAVRRYGSAWIELAFDLERGKGPSDAWLPGEIAWVIHNLARAAPVELCRSHRADGDGRKEPRALETEERPWRVDPADGLRPTLELRQRWARPSAA
jgi:N-acetylneuraminate synthase